jgi:hypothetical protein
LLKGNNGFSGSHAPRENEPNFPINRKGENMSFLSSVSEYTQGLSKARFSLFIFGLYMVVIAGCGFMFMPHFLLGLFGLSAGDDL